MKHDPIVEEIHRVRQKMLAECHGDLDQLLDRLQAAAPLDGDRMVSLEAVRERRQREQSRHLTTRGVTPSNNAVEPTASSVRSCLAVRRNSSHRIPDESGEDLEDIL